MAETKDQMQQRFETEVAALQEQLAAKDALTEQQAQRIAELETAERLLSGEEAVVNEAGSDWRDVEGTVDQYGRLQALSIGRIDRPGVLLRYLTARGEVLSCAPYRDAKMVAGGYESQVMLSYAG